jgi:hypothetical protein
MTAAQQAQCSGLKNAAGAEFESLAAADWERWAAWVIGEAVL